MAFFRKLREGFEIVKYLTNFNRVIGYSLPARAGTIVKHFCLIISSLYQLNDYMPLEMQLSVMVFPITSP